MLNGHLLFLGRSQTLDHDRQMCALRWSIPGDLCTASWAIDPACLLAGVPINTDGEYAIWVTPRLAKSVVSRLVSVRLRRLCPASSCDVGTLDV